MESGSTQLSTALDLDYKPFPAVCIATSAARKALLYLRATGERENLMVQKADSTVNVNSTGKKADPSTLLTLSKLPLPNVSTEEHLSRLSFGVICIVGRSSLNFLIRHPGRRLRDSHLTFPSAQYLSTILQFTGDLAQF